MSPVGGGTVGGWGGDGMAGRSRGSTMKMDSKAGGGEMEKVTEKANEGEGDIMAVILSDKVKVGGGGGGGVGKERGAELAVEVDRLEDLLHLKAVEVERLKHENMVLR